MILFFPPCVKYATWDPQLLSSELQGKDWGTISLDALQPLTESDVVLFGFITDSVFSWGGQMQKVYK